MVADVERGGALLLFLQAADSAFELFALGALGPEAERHAGFSLFLGGGWCCIVRDGSGWNGVLLLRVYTHLR